MANSSITEVIDLLHSLLHAPETVAVQLWANKVEREIITGL